MVLLQRQTSHPGTCSAELYGGYDSELAGFQHSKSDRSFSYGVDPEMSVDDKYKKELKLKPKLPSPLTFLLLLASIILFINGWKTNAITEETNKEALIMNLNHRSLADSIQFTEKEIINAHSDFEKLQVALKNSGVEFGFTGVKDKEGRKMVSDKLLDHDEAYSDRIVNLQHLIQRRDLDDLHNRYGKGPYKVEVIVRIDDKPKAFLLETAPAHLMPHSIHTFLDLVENKVWDDTMFIHKVDHVVLATPLGTDGNMKKPELSKKLLFPEYSEEFPHVVHSIGFQGRPGGPEIYINLDDNTEHHGPGGQEHHAIKELNTWQDLYDTQANCCATENPPSVPICTGAITGWYINWGAGGKCVQDDGQSGWNTLYESAAECCAAENDDPSCLANDSGTVVAASGLVASN